MEGAIMASLFQINGTNTYKVREELPVNAQQLVYPIYKDLTKPEMLRKCLHGKTQNANESLNGMIWERLPKIRYCGLFKLEMGVFYAVANFNYGSKASMDILKYLNIVPGAYMETMCIALNNKRISLSSYKGLGTSKKHRKVLRAQEKRGGDILKKKAPVMNMVDIKEEQ